MTAPVTAPTSSVKSNVITNYDASPIVRPSSGAGGRGRVERYQATITPAASQATTVLSRMVRIRSNAIVSRVAIILDTAATTLTGNVGVWYSDQNDGTGVINQGNLTAISSAFFASVLAMATFSYNPGTDPANVVGLSAPVDVTFAASSLAFTDANYVPSQSVNPIWLAIANLLALQTTPVGAFTSSSQAPHFQTASAGASVYVRSDDPGGFFDIGIQLTSTGSAANVPVTMYVDVVDPS
jgi:uncharacterized RmlC-like cupin family protein